MANEADLLAAERSLRTAAFIAGWTATQLRTTWSDGLGMWGGSITPLVDAGVGNSVANSELLQAELAARADDCSRAAATARAYKQAMQQYRTDLSSWNHSERTDPDGDHGFRPRKPDNGYFGSWPSWVSE